MKIHADRKRNDSQGHLRPRILKPSEVQDCFDPNAS
jgi:hypothetical protein